MNRQHHISLREEFDHHDGDGTKYIVLLDDGYPIATCRFYENSPSAVTLGRVVVLPDYRGQGLGRKAVEEAENWIRENLVNMTPFALTLIRDLVCQENKQAQDEQ